MSSHRNGSLYELVIGTLLPRDDSPSEMNALIDGWLVWANPVDNSITIYFYPTRSHQVVIFESLFDDQESAEATRLHSNIL